MVQTKLCIVTHVFLPHVGGIEKVVYEQSSRLKKLQFDPLVVTSRMHAPSPRYVVNGVPVQCYEALSLAFRLGIPYPILTAPSFKTLSKAVKQTQIVHAHGHMYLASFAASKLAKFYNKPFVLTQHNTFIEYDNIFDTAEYLTDLLISKQTINAADKIITVSQATKKYVLSLGAEPEKVEVLHNGVDLDRFKLIKGKREEIRLKHDISPKSKVVLTVRRLVYKNGVDTLIEAAALAAKKDPNIVFLVVGKGPDKESVQQRIAQLGIERNLLLAGFVSDDDLSAYYNAADMFVLPSKSGEGLPLVALEAMACGLPVIATDVGGIREILVDEFSRVIPPNNPYAMAEAVLHFADTPIINRDELRRIVEQKFSWDANVERLREIYEELI
jgi:glycosyltransferase involved in cell wall biosynthesis